MPNPYRKLPSGSPVTAFSITAYNRMLDMLNWWQSNQARSGGGPLRNLVDWDQTVFKTKNTSGAVVPTYGVVGLDGPLYGPTDNLTEFKNVTPMEGVAPVVADHAGGKWGVMLEMKDTGKIGRCCFAGVVPTRVYVNGADDGYCDIIAGETDGDYTCYLGTGASGAQILWRENEGSGAGTIVWAIVRLGATTGPIPFMLKTSLTPGGTATAYYTEPDGTIIDDSTPLTFTATDTIGDKRARGKDDMGSGQDGALGLAEVLSDGTVAITEIHQQAKRCSAALTADAGPGASVTVDTVVPLDGGMNPVNDSTSATIASCVMPPAARALDNATCVIEWDETTDTWKIDGGYLHQQARAIRGTLGGALTTTTASQTISSGAAMDGGQLPTGTITGHNEYTTKGMSGPSGGECVALWNETTDHYEFVWVEGIVQTVVTDYRIVTADNKFQKKTRSLAGWWDGDESAWTDVHTGDECP